MAVAAVVAVAMLAGCVEEKEAVAMLVGCVEEEKAPTSIPTVVPTATPALKFEKGDIVRIKSRPDDDKSGDVIKSGDAGNVIVRYEGGRRGAYIVRTVFLSSEGKWEVGRTIDGRIIDHQIGKFIESSYTKIGEIDKIVPISKPTPTPTPKFKKGDIIRAKSEPDRKGGEVIVCYEEWSGAYLLRTARSSRDEGKWEEIGTWITEQRKSSGDVESDYTKIGEIGEIAPTPKPTPIVKQAPTRVSNIRQVKVIYSGSWSGCYGDIGSLKSVEGTGTETFTISNPEFIVSASIQKKDDTDRTLTVEILKNGAVVKSESTSAAYGVVLLSYTL